MRRNAERSAFFLLFRAAVMTAAPGIIKYAFRRAINTYWKRIVRIDFEKVFAII